MSNIAINCVGDKCLVCCGKADVYNTKNNYKLVMCEACGRFEINDYGHFTDRPKDISKLASYLYYNGQIGQPIKTKPGHFFNFLGQQSDFEAVYNKTPYCYFVSDEIVENWYPKNFSEKIDMILLGLASLSKFHGDEVELTNKQLYSSFFFKRTLPDSDEKASVDIKRQYKYIIEFIITNLKGD